MGYTDIERGDEKTRRSLINFLCDDYTRHVLSKELIGKFVEYLRKVDERSKVPVNMSDCVKWLMPFEITCLYRNKDKVAFQMLEDRYPEYKGFINLF